MPVITSFPFLKFKELACQILLYICYHILFQLIVMIRYLIMEILMCVLQQIDIEEVAQQALYAYTITVWP